MTLPLCNTTTAFMTEYSKLTYFDINYTDPIWGLVFFWVTLLAVPFFVWLVFILTFSLGRLRDFLLLHINNKGSIFLKNASETLQQK